MNGRIYTNVLFGHTVAVYAPKTEKTFLPAVIFCGGSGIEAELSEIAAVIEKRYREDPPFILAGFEVDSWGGDYSPWPAPPLSEGGEPFSGNADKTADFLAKEFLPWLEKEYSVSPLKRDKAVIGYSLAGLGALYFFVKTGVFGAAACCSGSLWYKNWCSWLEDQPPFSEPGNVYLSLGKAERKIRSRLMAQNPGCMERTRELFLKKLPEGSQVEFIWNNGGHGFEVQERLASAIHWMLQHL